MKERRVLKMEIVVTRTKAQRECYRIEYMRIIRCIVVVTEVYAGRTQQISFVGCVKRIGEVQAVLASLEAVSD